MKVIFNLDSKREAKLFNKDLVIPFPPQLIQILGTLVRKPESWSLSSHASAE